MEYKYHPKNKKSLLKAIEKEIKIQGNEADLNCIDTSAITDMSELFEYELDRKYRFLWNEFNGDISKWDVSNVVDMSDLFGRDFNKDILDWNVSNVKNMEKMFSYCDFNGDLSKWNVRNVRIMESMFEGSKFLGDLSSWKVDKLAHTKDMFDSCRCTKPRWYKQ